MQWTQRPGALPYQQDAACSASVCSTCKRHSRHRLACYAACAGEKKAASPDPSYGASKQAPPATISAVAVSTRGSCSICKPLQSSNRVCTVLSGRTHLNSSKPCSWLSDESMSRYTSLPYSDRILSGFMILKRRPASKQSWKNCALSWKLRSCNVQARCA